MIPEYSASCLLDILRITLEIGRAWEARWSPKPMRFWFRGVDSKDYVLEPSLLRGSVEFESAQRLEWQIAYDFKMRARPYFDTSKSSAWDAMFMMQHYGFPTRLLDWAESLVVGAYFACRDVTSKSDGAIWLLAPNGLLEASYQDEAGATHLNAGHPLASEYKLCGPWDDVNVFNRKPPIPLFPDFLDNRIIVQSARFTVHTFKKWSLTYAAANDYERNHSIPIIHKIIIPFQAKAALRQHCQMFGAATEENLFPGLEGLSRCMWTELRENKIL